MRRPLVGLPVIIGLLLALLPAVSVSAMPTPGAAYTWGQNNLGQLGIGPSADLNAPAEVTCCAASGGVLELVGGRHHSVALAADGTVYAWGQNTRGQVGDGTQVNRNQPTAVLTGQDIVAVSAGHYHSMALTATGVLFVWGRNDTSQLGFVGDDQLVPTQLPGITDVVTMTGGRNHTAIVRADGTVWTFGTNTDGQLGNGSTGGEQATPAPVTNSTGIEAITSVRAGRDVTYAISNDGSLWVWGANSQGAIGDGTVVDRATPFEVEIGGVVADAAGGAFHSLAVRADGSVFAWGLNRAGEIGVNSGTGRFLNPQSVGVSDAVAVGAGRNHSLAIRLSGAVMSWGKNDFGQLGDGSTINRLAPVAVVGLTDAVAVEGGRSHSRALVANSTGPDVTPPLVVWSAPGSGAVVSAPVLLVGSASDDVGVDRVEMVVRDTGTGQFWNPVSGSWGGFNRFDVGVDDPGVAVTSFAFVFDPAGGSGNYRARVWAVDTSENDTIDNVSVSFGISSGGDVTPPLVVWSAPGSGAVVSAPVLLVGSASDDVGVDRVEMVVRDTGTGQFWNPVSGSWGGFNRFDVGVDDPGVAVTSFAFVFDPAGGSGNYRARVWAVDTSENDTIDNVSQRFSVS